MATRKRKTKLRKPSIKSALKDLLKYATGNGSSREGNPYMKPEVRNALKALGEEE